MKKLSYTLFAALFLASCSDDDPMPPYAINLDELTSSHIVKVLTYDGFEADGTGITFSYADGQAISKPVYEADMVMNIPRYIRASATTTTYYNRELSFNIHATGHSSDSITFYGESPLKTGEVEYLVEGVFKNYVGIKDTLFVHLKQKSPQAVFAGNTYELTWDEQTFDVSSFVYYDHKRGNETDEILGYAKEGMAAYLQYLKDRTGDDTAYRFTFHSDGTLEVQKRDSQSGTFETLPGHITYCIADDRSGLIYTDKQTADRLIQLLSSDPDYPISPEYPFYYVYPFDNLVQTCFGYTIEEDGIKLSLGDLEWDNLGYVLAYWQELTGTQHYTNGSKPLNTIFHVWSGNPPVGSQIWWRLKKI